MLNFRLTGGSFYNVTSCIAAVALAACSSSGSTGDTGGSGGTTTGSGGMVTATGGNGAKGGTSGTGGSTGTGGTSGGTGGNATGGSASGGSGPPPDGGVSNSSTTIPGNGCTPPAQYAQSLHQPLGRDAGSDRRPRSTAAWNQLFNPSNANTIFYNGPQSGEAYVKDIADNAVRSEGQSYGMMIAVQLDHQTEFDELWTFVKHYMWKSGNTIPGRRAPAAP